MIMLSAVGDPGHVCLISEDKPNFTYIYTAIFTENISGVEHTKFTATLWDHCHLTGH